MSAGFPFRAEQLARLARLSAATRAGAGAMPPIAGEVTIADGRAHLPNPDGEWEWMWVHSGLHLAWLPVPAMDGAVLVQFGGAVDEHALSGAGLASFVSRAGLCKLIADLGSIHDQLDPAQ